MDDGRNLRRVAELWTVNGNRMEIEGQIGKVCPTEANRYGRIGVAIHEAFELTYNKGIIDALINCSSNPPKTAQAVIGRIAREARGELIEIPTVEQRIELLKR